MRAQPSGGNMNLKIKYVSPKIGKEIPAPFYASAGAAAMEKGKDS